jgi:mannose-1-phosphate guanylyltransferase / mannose-6-phosphate isomerase
MDKAEMEAVILAGGSGTRLWPVSREAIPKPFMRLAGGPTLLQRTIQRAKAAGAKRCLIVTNREYAFQTAEDIETAGVKLETTLLLEPVGRNTAPAIAAAALLLRNEGRGSVPLLVLAADHLVRDEARFVAQAARAAELATEGAIVLFGIRPTGPETGFGYIECAKEPVADNAVAAVRFVEKPDAATALDFVASGRHLWNSGMFCFTADTVLRELQRWAPEVLDASEKALSAATPDARFPDRQQLDASHFASAPDISIDYAVMERAENVRVLGGDFGWSDIGSWNAVAAEHTPDTHGNTTSGDVVLADCQDTHVQSEDRLVAAIGLKGLVIVDTPDAVLVCDRDSTQNVKSVVAELKRRGHEAHRLHRTVARPWGTYTLLNEGQRFKIKRIEVKPGAALSLQMHHHRSEHWVVVSGTAKVTLDDRDLLLAPNESAYIPVGGRHRLANPGKVALVMIEVQCGDYVGEDDIVRFDDQYGRVASPVTSTSQLPRD